MVGAERDGKCGEVTSLSPARIVADVEAGLFHCGGERGRGRGGGQVSVGGRIATGRMCPPGRSALYIGWRSEDSSPAARFHPLCCAGLSSGPRFAGQRLLAAGL